MRILHYLTILLAATIFVSCGNNALSPIGKITAKINSKSWKSVSILESAKLSNGAYSLKAKESDNSEIHLFLSEISIGKQVDFQSDKDLGSSSGLICGFIGDTSATPTYYANAMLKLQDEGEKMRAELQTNELNVSHFEVFRQINETPEQQIASTQAIGTGVNNYSLLMERNLNTGFSLYRLRVTYNDQSLEWGNQVQVINNALFISAEGEKTICGGKIQVTAWNEQNKTISGTFELNAKDKNGNKLEIAKGEFNEISYSE
jgi:hypothetical protein